MADDPWDALSDIFSGATADGELPAMAADNVLLAWPPLLEVDVSFMNCAVEVMKRRASISRRG
jgi:hypothetical protein